MCRLGDAIENLAPFEKFRFVALTGLLFAVGVVRLVVNHEDITPVSKYPLNYGVWVLLGASPHSTQDGSRNEAAFFNNIFPNPVSALGFKRNGLPVLDHDIRMKFVQVFRRDSVEFFIKV